MKIAIAVCRPWTVAHRYRSLLLNAAQHDILCIGPKPTGGREELTKQLCDDVGVELIHPTDKKVVIDTLDSFNPDVIYGESINEPFEMWMQQWAEKHDRVGAVLDHTLFLGKPISDMWPERMKAIPNSTLMVTHPEREEECRGIKAVSVGVPELDLIHGCTPVLIGRKKILALFIGLWWYDHRDLQEDERTVLKPLFEIAKEQDWQVYVHLHGGERVASSSAGPEGLTFSPRYEYLLELQRWGAKFVGDYAGQIGDLKFRPITSFELMLSADCIVGTILSVWWKAYALGKKYIFAGTKGMHDYLFKDCGGYAIPMTNVEIDDPQLHTLTTHTMKSNSINLELPQDYADKYFMGLDGRCWERMLALC